MSDLRRQARCLLLVLPLLLGCPLGSFPGNRGLPAQYLLAAAAFLPGLC